MTRFHNLSVPAAAVLLLALAACEAKKSSNPLSPTVAGPIAGVEITQPRLLEPAQGFKFKENEQPIRLLIENSSSTGVRPITYTFEVATDAAFSNRVFARSGVAPGEGGRTSLQLEALELGRPYYWRARAEDGANSSAYATAGFELLPRAILTAPALVSPVNNARVAERQPVLVINNSQRNSAVGQVRYIFVVARDQAFTNVVASVMLNESSGSTQWKVDRLLEYNAMHFWRARATDGEVSSDWSSTQIFTTPAAPAPTPSPTPIPGPAPGGPCNSSSPEQIVSCERAKYGFMSAPQMNAFLRSVAQSLNRNGIGGGPFGILRKGSGTNCLGYSCDIICAGQGNGQRQWDVIGDIEGAQAPGWAGPHVWPHIRVDACEIQ
jgi:hypothetical protein